MLMGEEVGILNEKQKEYLKEIHYGNQRMINLVDSLLSISRIELGTFAMQLGPVNITAILDDILKELQTQINKKDLEINGKYKVGIPIIKSDQKLIRIVFQNLLLNAIEYTPPKGKISIETKKTDKGAHIEIGDTGCGIPKSSQSNIYTKFFRADNARSIKSDGNGLGLYLTKSIVEALEGSISFKSKEGEGTVFYVDILDKSMSKKS
jgi:signal transduction histidine kinase